MKREWFKKFNNFDNDTNQVKVGNGSLVCAKGIGDVEVKVINPDGSHNTHTIRDVWYVPEKRKTLLSIGHSSAKGMRVIF